MTTEISKKLDFNRFVDLAWRSYLDTNFEQMASNLKHALDSSPLVNRIELINRLVDRFESLATESNSVLDTYSLVNLPEWKQLIDSVLISQNSLNTQFKPRCSIITSVFKGDKYIEPFLEDITRQTIFEQCELILINPNSPGNEEPIILKYVNKFPNIIYKRLDRDPGLYEVWNWGIRMARADYVTNANLDDRRAPHHIEEHLKGFQKHPEVDLVCSPLKPTHEINETWDNNTGGDAWYVGYPQFFGAKDLFQPTWEGRDPSEIGSQNIPHCMPVWKKSLHDRYGYFDEDNYGSSADWEFWLRCATNGSKYMLLKEPLGLYLIDPNSYQRKFDTVSSFEQKIFDDYYERANQQRHSKKELKVLPRQSSSDSGEYPRKLNLAVALESYYGNHRSGWSCAVNALAPLHSNTGIYVDTFIEKKFVFGTEPGEKNNHPVPYQEPWVGFIHCPPHAPSWFQPDYAPQNVFQTELWQQSFKYCQGLFCLTENMRFWLEKQLDVPVENLIHPTEIPEIKFSMSAFLDNPEPKIVQIGHWLRKLHSIYYIPTDKYHKITLSKSYADVDIVREKEVFDLQPDYESVKVVDHLPNDEYDWLLAKNIVYVEMYDTCANNAVLECIVRNTPLLINPLPGVIEYLGQDYPFYFTNREEAAKKAEDLKLVEATYEYLKHHPFKEKFTCEYFLKSVAESKIYRSLQ